MTERAKWNIYYWKIYLKTLIQNLSHDNNQDWMKYQLSIDSVEYKEGGQFHFLLSHKLNPKLLHSDIIEKIF